jgi:hypothetical protein
VKKLLIIALFALASLSISDGVNAASPPSVGIQLRPLLYHETLKTGQVEKGFLDVSNPTTSKVTLDTSVQLFNQTDDSGTLKFYDALYAKTAIVPDLKEFDLGPHEAVRLYFTVDSNKLPDGDVLAAIFVTNKVAPKPLSITPAVRVGTLLILENGKPGSRNSAITDFSLPFFQTGNSIHGSVSVKNMAPANQQSAFFADVNLGMSPWGESVVKQSPLITTGRTRSMSFDIPSNQIGFFKVTVSTKTASAFKWVFVLTGVWRTLIFVVIGAFAALIIGIWLLIKRRKKRRSA